MEPVVALDQGILRGKIQRDRKKEEFFSFLGIPYAQPPLGDLRFKPPQPAEPWEGIRDATQPGECCYALQDAQGPDGGFIVEEKGSEDCLYLNVYTRGLPKPGRSLKPVMVYIHGGGFVNGSAHPDIYGPEHLICEDIVLVSMNYRLGIFGFLCLEDPNLGIPGNAGLKDQVMALKWVQKNIKHFGGDPKNVTIFGESAGGASTHYLMLSPMCKGLFHKVIIQSGCAINCWARCLGNVSLVADGIGVDPKDEKEILRQLQSLSTEEAFAVQKRIPSIFSAATCSPFAPVIEKPSVVEPLLTEDAFQLMMTGDYNHVPVMIGFTSGELYVYHLFRSIGLFEIHVADCDEDIVPFTLQLEKDSDKYKEVVKKIKQFYFGCGDKYKEVAKKIKHYYFGSGEPLSVSKGLYDLGSDNSIIRGVYTTAKKLVQTSKQPVYFYRMSLETNLNDFKKMSKVEHEGATHCDDLMYIFHNKQTPEVEAGSVEDVGIERFVKMWANFAKTSNPIDPTQDVLKGIKWEPVTAERFNYLDIGLELVPGINPEAERMSFWDELYSSCPEHLRY